MKPASPSRCSALPSSAPNCRSRFPSTASLSQISPSSRTEAMISSTRVARVDHRGRRYVHRARSRREGCAVRRGIRPRVLVEQHLAPRNSGGPSQQTALMGALTTYRSGESVGPQAFSGFRLAVDEVMRGRG